MQRNKDAEVSDPLSPTAVVRISSRLLVKFNSIKNIPGTLTGFWGTLKIICEVKTQFFCKVKISPNTTVKNENLMKICR